jgi:hypothetical protein
MEEKKRGMGTIGWDLAWRKAVAAAYPVWRTMKMLTGQTGE